MSKDRWYPSDKVLNYVFQGPVIRGYTPKDLYDKCKFYVKDQDMAGITWSKDNVTFSTKFSKSRNAKYQAEVVYHELVHVAQQLTMPQGWVGFMVTYGWQWVISGFSYKRMKKRGIEEEAYRMQKVFADLILYKK